MIFERESWVVNSARKSKKVKCLPPMFVTVEFCTNPDSDAARACLDDSLDAQDDIA